MSDLTFSPPSASTALLSLIRRQDHSLYLDAAARWRDSRDGLHALIAQAPGVRDSIEALLQEHLQLGGAPVGLGFLKSAQQDEHFVSLAHAWAFVCQFPDIAHALNTQSTTVGLVQHRLVDLTPVQLLEHLKALNLGQLLSARWHAYWSTRAPGTPLSRSEHAAQLYRQHFEACGQLSLANGQMTVEQLKPLQPILNPIVLPNDSPATDTWQLTLKLPNQSKVKLPGAWVITERDKPLHAQTLYLPCRNPSVMLFNQRSEMEQWLTAPARQLVPQDLDPGAVTVDYTPRNEPLEHGILDLLSHLHTAQLESLSNRHRNGADLRSYANRALDDADQLDRQRRENPVLTAPPIAPHRPEPDDESPAPLIFGQLHAGIDLTQRWAAVQHQRMALETYLAGSTLEQLDSLIQPLNHAEQAAATAAGKLLDKSTSLEHLELRQKPNTDYDALYQARVAALQAEAAIQHALKQISNDEQQMIQAVLDHPAAPAQRAQVAVTRLVLVSDDPKDGSQELTGALLFTTTRALTATEAHSLLLYWPGSHGGLQRFESQQALEQWMFQLPASERGATLQLSLLTGDPFEYALQQQLYASEQQAFTLISRDPTQQRAEALDELKTRTLFNLQVPLNPARELAYSQLREQQRSSTLATSLPAQLSQLPEAQRLVFKPLILAQIKALQRAQHLLERDLEPFDDFSQRRLGQRLREDFMLEQPFDVHVDLPDAVSQEREYVTPYAGPGTPFKYVTAASSARSIRPLLQLAQHNIDPALAERLAFMKVQVTSPDSSEAERLSESLTLDYLKGLVSELDLAGEYEQRITLTFLGDPATSPFTLEHHLECLTEPLRQMLLLHGQLALAQGRLSDADLQLLKIAIDANTTAAWQVDGKHIALLPARLSAGGKDTDQGPTTLSGITFIHEQHSGVTLLYLPDSPDGQDLRRYPSLELARKSLFERSVSDTFSTYLAHRAIKGDTQAHLARLTQAHLKNFDAMVAVGDPWPATTSLARHLLNAHMGRVIEAHRATARSNATLLLEQNALRSGMVFNYLKIALGLVPFVGAAIALYDAWTSANLATAAFLRGKVGHGLAEVEAVLLSLIDCAMDILPGTLVVSPATASAATRQRQLRQLGQHPASLHVSSVNEARRALQRFAGYEYEKVISLTGLHPQTHGLYRNVYRHADGDFILRRGRIYQVELAGDPLDWRLSPTRSKSYKQPIALSELGEWDTHYGVYGTAFKGGLAGGGGVLGHMADVADPIWPQAVRDWLPRWMTDRVYRRQQALRSSIGSRNAQVLDKQTRIQSLADRFDSGDTSVIHALEKQLAENIQLASQLQHEIEQLAAMAHGNRATLGTRAKSDVAYTSAWNVQWQTKIKSEQIVINDEAIDGLLTRLDNTPYEQLSARAALREQIRAKRVANLDLLRQLDTSIEALNTWEKRITITQQRQGITAASEVINRHFSARRREKIRASALMELVDHRKGVGDASWHYLQRPLNNSKSALFHALYLQANMLEVGVTLTQRNTLLSYCIDVYGQMRSNLNRWTASYPQHFDATYVEELAQELQKMSERARKALSEPMTRRTAGSTRRVFETEDRTLLIGVEELDTANNTRRYTLTGAENRTEIWAQNADGRFYLTNPAPVAPPLPAATNALALLSEARARLNAAQAYVKKVEEYARHTMLPVDLEEMLVREADELLNRARTLERPLPQDPIILQLRDKAAALTNEGRNLRVRQTLASKTPTEGYLDYLRDQQVVEIRRGGTARNLNEGHKGRPDYLQEYTVWDVTKTPQVPLWYAHFHYDKAGAQFDEFIKAHLKTPEQRNLGLQWQRAQAEAGAGVESIWRGNIGRPMASLHFAGV